MAEIIIIISVISIILLTAVEPVTATVSKHGEYVIKIDFSLFMLLLYPDRNKKKKSKNKKENGRSLIYETVNFMLKRSAVLLHNLSVPLNGDNPFLYPLTFGFASTGVSAVLAFLNSHSKIFEIEDNAVFFGSFDKLEFDISIKAMLFDAVRTYIFYRNRKRSFEKHVRKQNE